MKTKFYLLSLLLCSEFTGLAQNQFPEKKSTYDAWISELGTRHETTGTLYEVRDSAVILSWKENIAGTRSSEVRQKNFDAGSIDVISVRKKGSATQGALIGICVGAVAGLVIDIAILSGGKAQPTTNNQTVNQVITGTSAVASGSMAVLATIACVGVGFGIGIGVGSAKVAIPIKGNRDKFEQNKAWLNNRAEKPNAELLYGSLPDKRKIMKDSDSNQYHVMTLNGYSWMAEDLRSTHFRDGSAIEGISANTADSGRQYNMSAVRDPRGICPAGWHIPSMKEWTSMINTLGDEYSAPLRFSEYFCKTSKVNKWWTSTVIDSLQMRSCTYNREAHVIMFPDVDKSSRLAVRCLKD